MALIRDEAENCIERGGFAGAVGPDEPQNATFFDAQVHAVQRDCGAEGLAKSARFYACHGFSVPPLLLSTSIAGLRRPAVLPLSVRAAECFRKPGAILRREISGVRLAAADSLHRD